jgi:CHASE2 domain-containing sensor protein
VYSPKVRRKLQRGVAVLSLAIAAAVCLLWQVDALTWAENRSSDWRARATADPLRANRDIVIIDIDNASYRSLTDKLGRWPWTRRVWTELVRYLTPGQPRLILFDVLFSGQEPAADTEFAGVLRAAGNVLLPFSFVSGRVDTQADIFTPPDMARVALDGAAPGEGLRRDVVDAGLRRHDATSAAGDRL